MRPIVLSVLVGLLGGCGASEPCDFDLTCAQIEAAGFEPANQEYDGTFDLLMPCPQCERHDAACWRTELDIEVESASCRGEVLYVVVGPAALGPLCAHEDLKEVGISSPECDVED